jgi:hypothetical protein
MARPATTNDWSGHLQVGDVVRVRHGRAHLIVEHCGGGRVFTKETACRRWWGGMRGRPWQHAEVVTCTACLAANGVTAE